MKTYSSPNPTGLLARLSSQLRTGGARILTDKATGIVALTGLAALLAAFRLALSSETTAENLFQTWMIDWILVWAAFAVMVFFMLQPLFIFLKSDRQSYREAVLLRQMALLEPNLAQELRTLGMYQQRRDEEAAQAKLDTEESLAALGSLTAPLSAASKSRFARKPDVTENDELVRSVNQFSPAA